MTLLFYDFEFNLLFAENRVNSLRWNIYYNDIGTFEAHIPINSQALKIISDNKYLVVKEGDRCAIVIGKEISDDAAIYGRTCNWLMTKRVAGVSDTVSADAGVLCRELASEAFSDVENFELGDWHDTAGTVEMEISSPELLSRLVKDCLESKKLGHCIDFDTVHKKWIFNILKGTKRDLIISESNKNAYGTKITEDILDLATCGYYNAETDNGQESVFYDSGEKSGIYRWEALLSGKSESEAKISLDGKSEKNAVTLFTRNIHFGTDYGQGDIVRVQVTKGCLRTTQKKRVIGVEFCFSGGQVTEQPIFEDIGGTNGI